MSPPPGKSSLILEEEQAIRGQQPVGPVPWARPCCAPASLAKNEVPTFGPESSQIFKVGYIWIGLARMKDERGEFDAACV